MLKFFRSSLCHSASSLLVLAAPTSLPLLFFFYLTLVLSSPSYPLLHLFFHLKLCGRSGTNSLLSPPVLSGYNGSPDTCFSQGTMNLMSWLDGECYLRPLQSLVVSLFLSCISTLLFFWTGGILSHRNSLTHKFPQFPSRNLCSLVTLTVFSLIYTATDTAFCYDLIPSGLAESRILPAVPVDTRSRTPLNSFCSPAMDSLRYSLFGDSLFTTCGSGLGELASFWGSMLFHHGPIPRKGSVNNKNNNSGLQHHVSHA